METQNKKLKSKINIYWFTLVELIIVITILAILATIGFMSYQSYVTESKDTNRIATLKMIKDGLVIEKTKKQVYPMPDDYITIIWDWTAVWYQWYIWEAISKKLRMSETKDPLDNKYYTYYLNADKTMFKLVWFLENDPSKLISYLWNKSVNIANALDYSDRYIYTVWDNIWVILDAETNTPIQEIVSPATTLNLNNYNTNMDLYTSNTDVQTWTGWAILDVLNVISDPTASCVLWVSLIWSCTLN